MSLFSLVCFNFHYTHSVISDGTTSNLLNTHCQLWFAHDFVLTSFIILATIAMTSGNRASNSFVPFMLVHF